MTFDAWWPFFVATVLISLSPGPGAIAAMGAGLNHGFARGQRIALGLMLGVWTQLLVVGVGLGALLATSTVAFAVVKWLGVAYLVWLGIQQWRAPAKPLLEGKPGTQARGELLLRGWSVNAINPKGTVFLLAVMPQFLDPQAALPAQYLTIAATFGAVEFAVMTGYVALAARLLGWLQSPRQMQWMSRCFGSLFILAGLALARFHRHA
ncbi:MAG: threonine transporter RhtB [Ideonella sp. MAG2]|nr:MAG: threonine transporter RhtB [Ideonella sp. MAG2]